MRVPQWSMYQLNHRPSDSAWGDRTWYILSVIMGRDTPPAGRAGILGMPRRMGNSVGLILDRSILRDREGFEVEQSFRH
jgi:hypothetical protein